MPVIPPVRIDLSRMIFDKTAECCDALRQIFTSKVSIVVFRPFEPVLSELLADFYVCIALPASIADSLAAGQPTAMPFPLGQLNPTLCVEAALRKMSHWLRQDCFSEHHCREVVEVLCFRPLRAHITTELKRPSGVGGFAKFHNCSFIGFSWCLVIDSDQDSTFKLPTACQQTAIVLKMNRLSLTNVAGIVHNAAYVHWLPTEGWHRHCSFPLTMRQIDGIPALSLLNDDLKKIAQQDIENFEDQDESLDDEEYRILIGAASAIERKRKTSAS